MMKGWKFNKHHTHTFTHKIINHKSRKENCMSHTYMTYIHHGNVHTLRCLMHEDRKQDAVAHGPKSASFAAAVSVNEAHFPTFCGLQFDSMFRQHPVPVVHVIKITKIIMPFSC